MLQNPSKYHPNPLSHFLALHNSANNHHHHHYQQSAINNHNHSLNGNSIVNTSLDVGKSFTIAAILGLQKNAIEHHQQNHRDFNSVMNLSLNSHNINNNQKNNSSNDNFDIINCVNNNNNNNCNTNRNSNNNNSGNNSNGVNNFDCDSVNSVVNRYLPNTNGNNNEHLRIAANHFGAVAVANKVNGPSALQSLQQLHQQHAQQQAAAAAAASLGYQRDKIKDHFSSKKSSLKSKRVRTIFTPEQLERLEAEFERQQYMVGPERLYLAHTLQLTEAQVKVWFQNRRIKWRKHHLEITQQRLALIRQTQITNGDEEIGTNGITNNSANDLVGNIMTQDILSTNNDSPIIMTPINNHLNNNQSESDLSICNDSLDGESIVDGDES